MKRYALTILTLYFVTNQIYSQDIDAKIGDGGNFIITDSNDEQLFKIQSDAGALFTGTFDAFGTIPIEGIGTRMMWYPKKAAFRVGRVSGTEWNDANIGNYSIAIGGNTVASGDFSASIGLFSTAGGDAATAIGELSTASGDYSTAIGVNTTASGYASIALGENTTASGKASTTLCSGTIASGHYSTAMGRKSTASGDYSTAMGSQTVASSYYSTALGENTTASGYASIAMGSHTTASANQSTALNHGTTASGNYSTAIGYNTTASGNYSTTMGEGITASGEYTVAIALNNQGGTNVTQSNTMAIMGGDVGIGTVAPTSKLQVVGIPGYATDAAAGAAGLTAGAIYQTSGHATLPDGVLMVKQ